MFERFSENAIKALLLAQEEAARFGLDYCGSEHILLGLIGVNGNAAKVVKSKGLSLGEARAAIEKATGRKSVAVSKSWLQRLIESFKDIPFSTAAKRVLELCWDEAQIHKVNYVDDDFLLLAILRLDDDLTVDVLKQYWDLDELRSKVLAEKKFW